MDSIEPKADLPWPLPLPLGLLPLKVLAVLRLHWDVQTVRASLAAQVENAAQQAGSTATQSITTARRRPHNWCS